MLLRIRPSALAALALVCSCATGTAPAPHASGAGSSQPLPEQRFAQGVAPAGAVHLDARKRLLSNAMGAVDSYLREHSQDPGCPGLSVGVVLGSELLWAQGYGVKDGQRKEPVDRSTVFRIGSITKTFTGAALLQLRDAGKLSLDDALVRWIPEASGILYPSADSPLITLRHLVTHTSGLPRLGAFDYTKADRAVTEAQVLEALDGLNLESVPGTRASYSNLGLALAGLVVARASGQPYRDYVTANLLRPLGMTNTVWDREQVPAERLATGYELKNGRKIASGHWRLGAAEAMGGLYSSAEDLAKWAAFELAAWPPRDGAETLPLKRASIRESQQVEGPGWAPGQQVGVTWGVRSDTAWGSDLVAHVGQNGGYSAAVRLLPQRGLGVVALCSSGDAPERLEGLANEVLSIAVRSDVEPARPLSNPVELALGRFVQQLAAPQLAQMKTVFSPAYLAELPPEQMLKFFTDARRQSGDCKEPMGLSSEGLYSATVRLPCQKQSWKVSVKVLSSPPYLINSLWVEPVGRE